VRACARRKKTGAEALPEPIIMRALLLLFAAVFGLNVIPAFAPPTWMVFSYIGFRYVSVNHVLLAVVGASAATLGRMALAKMARVVVRQRFMSESSRQNIDSIREYLQPRRKLTFGVFLFYAFTPFPSNYLFIAYGLTSMELRLIAAPFFIGRSISYSFWAFTASTVARRIAVESTDALSYLSLYFVASQIILLSLIYVFTRIDWRALFEERKLRWLAKVPARPDNSAGKPPI
jgi:membrane protein YqaA with SNARE-associated domain